MAVYKKYVNGAWVTQSTTFPVKIGGRTEPTPPLLQTKSITPSETAQPVTADAGFDGLERVNVAAISPTYVGSGVTRKEAATITPGLSAQTIAANQYLTGAQTVAAITGSLLTSLDSDFKAENIRSGVNMFGVVGTHEGGGGGGSGVQVSSSTAALSSAASSIRFTGLLGEPTSFVVVSAANLATGASPYKTAAVVYDGTEVHGQYITNTNNAQMTYSAAAFSQSYSAGTLTVTGTGANFQANEYKLIYSYGGSAADVKTVDVQVGSGVSSITFTGLAGEPSYFSCIFKSNIGTASGYTRAHVVAGDGTQVFGMEMGSQSQASDSHWTANYSNGSFTIRSDSTSQGGYFHQPGYYQLTYVIAGESGEITAEPLSVTANGTYTAPAGKAYTPVTVNVPTTGGKAAQASDVMARVNSTTLTATTVTLTVGKTGTYTVRWYGYRTGTSGTNGSQLYIGNTAYGSEQTTFSVNNNGQTVKLTNVSLTQGQTITVRARSSGSYNYMFVMGLSIIEE